MLHCLHTMHGEAGPFLLVVPLSTLQHWQRELDAWTTLHSVIFHGPREARDVLLEHEWVKASADKCREEIERKMEDAGAAAAAAAATKPKNLRPKVVSDRKLTKGCPAMGCNPKPCCNPKACCSIM